MKQTKPIKSNHPHLRQRLGEGLLIFSAAVALFLLLALITYHPSDPGWSNSGLAVQTANAGGHFGAWLADILLLMFGYSAYLLPPLLVYAAIAAWHRPQMTPSDNVNYYWVALRSSGLLLILLTSSALIHLYAPMPSAHLPYSAGGILGAMLSEKFAAAFNYSGSALLLLGGFLCGCTLFNGLSWIKLADRTGNGVLSLLQLLRQVVARRRAANSDNAQEDPVFNQPSIPARAPLAPRPSSLAARQSLHIEPKIDLSAMVEEDELPSRSSPPPIINARPQPTAALPAEQKKTPPKPMTTAFLNKLPSITLLDMPEKTQHKGYSKATLEAMSRAVEQRLQDFGIHVQVVAVHPGPVITRFEIALAPGIKVSRITGLAKDLARSLSVVSVRVVEVIPGKSVVGLELPNEHREMVRLREIIASGQYTQASSPMSMALGKDIAGHPVVVDLTKMPHLLVAGTTGAGKSVGLNAMLLSILYKSSPQEVRMIMIDPKMLELSIYEGIPHLLAPVVTDMREAANALRWCVAEMDRRYRLMAALGVRNLAGYNSKITEANEKGQPINDPTWRPDSGLEPTTLETLPYILVLVDEFADMIMVVGKKVEELIARIAQKARAAGIHMILATQRPSVDVITGLIKANVPTRIAFQVSSRIDSRTILDQQGAEQLLGHGDMLYLAPGTGVPVRVHGAYVADHEVHKVVNDLKQRGAPAYLEEILAGDEGGGEASSGANAGSGVGGEGDALYDQAVQIVIQSRRASISNIQRRLKIGYNRAARLIEDMEAAGIVSSMERNGNREVLVAAQEA